MVLLLVNLCEIAPRGREHAEKQMAHLMTGTQEKEEKETGVPCLFVCGGWREEVEP